MVKFSRGDVDLDRIIISFNELLTERLSLPVLAASDSSQDQQTLLGANVDSQSTGEGVLTDDDELLIDLGSILSSIQGKQQPYHHLAISVISYLTKFNHR